jgi:nucleoside-diphosphate-sugar epimerase
MKILVTGGAGFLGGHLIPKLAASGHEVIALTRSNKDSAKLAALGAKPIMGDLETIESMRLPAIDAVVHAADRCCKLNPGTSVYHRDGQVPYFVRRQEETTT